MRRPLMAILMLGLLATIVGLVVSRPVQPHPLAPPPRPAPTKAAAKAPRAPAPKKGPAPAIAVPADAGTSPASAKLRTLRLVGLGWDVVAPAVVAEGGGALRSRGLAVSISAADDMTRLGGALARGGDQPDGADVAVLPLATFVASYERLRALEPEIFFVVGWSRGREALAGTATGALQRPPAGPVALVGDAGAAATGFALLAFDLAGIDLARVQLVGPEDLRRTGSMFHAVDRGTAASPLPSDVRLLLTSADARRAVPLVAIAPRGLLAREPEVARAFVQGWLAGVEELRADVPAAARRVAAQPEAPEVVALLERLGQIEPATLADNVRGLSARDPSGATVPALFARAWRLWRATGVLSTPPPETVPLSLATVTGLAGRAPARTSPAAVPAAGSRVLLAHPVVAEGHPDPDPVASDIALCAGLFEGHALRVSLRGRAPIEPVLESAAQRFGLAPARLIAGRTTPGARALAVIEILGD